MALVSVSQPNCCTTDPAYGTEVNGIGGWGVGSSVASPRTGSAGSYALSKNTAVENWWFNTEFDPAIPNGVDVTHDFWTRKTNSNVKSFTMFWLNTGGPAVAHYLSTSWQNKTQTFTSTSTIYGYRMAWQSGQATQVIYLDDWKIYYNEPNQPPYAPSALRANGQLRPESLNTLTPKLSFLFDDPNSGDYAQYYQIQVTTDSSFSTITHWDSGQTQFSTYPPGVIQGSRTPDITYAGSTLSEGIKYYWRAKTWDDEGAQSGWSNGTDYFVLQLGQTIRGTTQLKSTTIETVDITSSSIDVGHLDLGSAGGQINASVIPFPASNTYKGTATQVMDALEEGVVGGTLGKKKESAAGDGSTTQFTLANTPYPGKVKVFNNGILQIDGASEDYTISGSTITFNTAPQSADKLLFIYWAQQ